MNTEHESSVIRIPLANGQGSTIVDADYTPSSWQWKIKQDTRTAYAMRSVRTGGKWRVVYLHREVMAEVLGRPLAPGEEVDHINHDGLDNRRQNLRLATRAENQHNYRTPSTNTSGFKGVSWDKRSQKWRATISLNRRDLHLGYYTDKRDAARAYDEAAIRHFGDFARLNFPTAPNE